MHMLLAEPTATLSNVGEHPTSPPLSVRHPEQRAPPFFRLIANPPT